MGKSTISMAMFNSNVLNYQRNSWFTYQRWWFSISPAPSRGSPGSPGPKAAQQRSRRPCFGHTYRAAARPGSRPGSSQRNHGFWAVFSTGERIQGHVQPRETLPGTSVCQFGLEFALDMDEHLVLVKESDVLAPEDGWNLGMSWNTIINILIPISKNLIFAPTIAKLDFLTDWIFPEMGIVSHPMEPLSQPWIEKSRSVGVWMNLGSKRLQM